LPYAAWNQVCELLIEVGELGKFNCEVGNDGAVSLTTKILQQVAFDALPAFSKASRAVASPATNL